MNNISLKTRVGVPEKFEALTIHPVANRTPEKLDGGFEESLE